MPPTQIEFWKLVEQSRLLTADQCRHLQAEFAQATGGANLPEAAPVSDWLVSRNIFSKYQATVLLAGRPGPFVYGDYRIYDRVENGRLAQHFRAVHAGTGHPVLLQFLTGPAAQDPRQWAIAANEARIACQIVHPNVQRYHELVDLGPFKFLVSEDLRGETLEERLAVGRMSPPEACRIARAMAMGLMGVHQTQRPHGDVRPLNVWLEPPTQHQPGGIKLLRDALAPPAPPNFAQDDPHGRLLAQSDYLAPEFQMPGRAPDVLTDLYALGCTLYHLLAGHPPFPGGSVMQKMARHAAEPIRPLESYGVPAPHAQLVAYLMAKNPAVRYQDAGTVAEQLGPFVDPAVVHLPPPMAPPTLPAYEAAVRQSHARLATQAVQQAIGPVAAQPKAAAVPTGAIPSGAIPSGTAVGQKPTGPVIKTGLDLKGAVDAKPAGFDPRNPAAFSTTANAELIAAAKEAREKKKLITILVSVGVALISLIIGVNAMNSKPKEEDKQVATNDPNSGESLPVIPPPVELTSSQSIESILPDEPNKTPSKTPPNKTEDPEAGKKSGAGANDPQPQTIVPDDGKLPWASPTDGAPIDLKYVPPDARVFMIVRPADLLASSEGAKVLQAMGPVFQSILQRFEQASGFAFGDLEQAIVTLHNNDNKFPRVAIVARPKTPVPIEELPARWNNAAPQQVDGKTYYNSGGWAFYPPADQNGSVFLMVEQSPDQAAKEDGNFAAAVIKAPAPLLSKDVEILRRATDSKRHFNLLFYPSFLFSGDGDPLFTGDFARIKEPLRTFIGGTNIEEIKAGAVSMHFGDPFYFEMRVQTSVDKDAHKLINEFRERLKTVSEDLKTRFREDRPPAYWNKFAYEFPRMIGMLHDNMRLGVEDGRSVVNSVLPGAAGHNLVLGTELAIATAPGSSGSVASAPTAGGSAGPKTLEEAMNVKMKEFSFPQLSLEFAVQELETNAKDAIGSSVPFSIRIIGKDLEIDGITRNQSIANFKEENKTVGEMLAALARKADPRVVWVIAEDPDDKKTKILVTTKAAAAKKSYKVPAMFQ